jgi:predicted CXXCH cytochrome family protein
MKNKMVNKFAKASADEKSAICMNCHSGQRHLAFWESGKHAKNEVACNNCHNIHGKPGNPVVAPFTTTARPIEADVCGACHNPHGSSHLRLLNENVPNLCQDCHDVARHPGTPYGAGAGWICQPGDTTTQCANKTGQFNANVNTRFIARACVNCHIAVHGSNAPGNRGQFFTR